MVNDNSNPFTGEATRLILETMKHTLKENPNCTHYELEWEAAHALHTAFDSESVSKEEQTWINGAARAFKAANT